MIPLEGIAVLIIKITPNYNYYTQNRNTINWKDALELQWEVWDILKEYLDTNSNIAPHNLYREIYWKSEWTENIHQKSYITRDFLSRCYRVRNIFENKDEIRNTFPTLVSYHAFYKAMPFFDNPKYKFTGKKREELINLLNTCKSKKGAMDKIYELLDKYVNVKNPRTQKLWELSDIRESFVCMYKHLNTILASYEAIEIDLHDNDLSKEELSIISNNIVALTNDAYLMKPVNDENKSEVWWNFIRWLNKIALEKTPKKRRRLRRIINSSILVRISDMVTALESKEYYDNFLRRN